MVRCVADLRPQEDAAFDLDDVAEAEAIEIGRRFRSLGVRLAVAARLDAEIPEGLRRNLAYGH